MAFPAANVAIGILIAVKHVIGDFPSGIAHITGVVAVIVIKVARVNLSCNATVSTDGTAIAGEHMPRRTSLAAPLTIRIAVVCVLVIGVVLVQFSAIGALERAGIQKCMSIIEAGPGSDKSTLVTGIILLIVIEMASLRMVGITTAHVTFVVAKIIVNAGCYRGIISCTTRTRTTHSIVLMPGNQAHIAANIAIGIAAVRIVVLNDAILSQPANTTRQVAGVVIYMLRMRRRSFGRANIASSIGCITISMILKSNKITSSTSCTAKILKRVPVDFILRSALCFIASRQHRHEQDKCQKDCCNFFHNVLLSFDAP